MPVDQLGDHLDARAAHPLGRAWDERPCHQAPQSLVLGAIEAEQLFGDAVPDRAGRDALQHQADALRHDEPGVSQHGAYQFAAEHLGPKGPSAIGPWRCASASTRRISSG
jgi:hypothetical protein